MTKYWVRNLLVGASFISIVLIWVLADWSDQYNIQEYRDNKRYTSDLHFSVRPGFYDNEFDLVLTAPTNQIYYTVDCSEPDNTSIAYVNPIHITDASRNPNIYSSIEDVSTGFYEEYIDKGFGYSVPLNNIDKCVVVRACFYDENGEKSKVLTGTYFVGGVSRDSTYDNIAIMTITTSPENLFDYNNGIYVTGAKFDNFLQQDGLNPEVNPMAPYWWWWTGNYSQRGTEWEREGTLQYYDEKHNLMLTQATGIRIQGGGSRGYNPKSLNLYARSKYDGNDVFHFDFWNNGYMIDKITLSACGDDKFSKIQDRIVAEMCEQANLNVHYFHFKPCMLFLDGEFWGFYYLLDAIDADEISNRYSVSKDNVVVIKSGALEEGEPEELQELSEVMEFLNTANLTDDNQCKKVWNYFDQDSTIDYLACMIYIARNGDFAPIYANSAIWKTRECEKGRFGDTRYRWIVYDVNSGGLWGSKSDYHSLNICTYDDTLSNLRAQQKWIDNLCCNEDFYNKLLNRLIWLSEGVFSSANTNRIIDKWEKELDAPMEAHMNRFFGEDNAKFYECAESVRKFLEDRPDVIREYYSIK